MKYYSYILVLLLTACTDYPDKTIIIDSYYELSVVSSDEANQTYIDAKTKSLYGNYNLIPFCSSVSEKEKSYFAELNTSQRYYLKITFFTDKTLALEGPSESFYKIVAPAYIGKTVEDIHFLEGVPLTLQYEDIVSPNQYKQVFIYSIAHAKGINMFLDSNQSKKDSRVLFPSTLQDVKFGVDFTYFPQYLDKVDVKSNVLTITAEEIQAVLDLIP